MDFQLNWLDEKTFEIGGHKITFDWSPGTGSRRQSEDQDFIIMKGRNFLRHYTPLAGQGFKKVLELGVYQGGSFVFFDQMLQPDRFSAVELSGVPVPALDRYVARSPDRLRIHYGTSQDDVARLNEIVESEFSGELDLVLDDASHWYEPTIASFRTLFPKVRPGGLYVIEDWSWSFDKASQEPTHPWYDRSSLVNMIPDLLEDMAHRNLVESVQIERELITIRRSSLLSASPICAGSRRGRVAGLL